MRHRDILTEWIAAYLGTYHLLSSPAPVTANLITEERDDISTLEVSTIYWLRVFVRMEVTHPERRAATTKTLNEIPGKPNKTIVTAAGRLIDASRTVMVDCDRPHASQMMLFLRYIPEDNIQALMWRLSALATPVARERVPSKATVVFSFTA